MGNNITDKRTKGNWRMQENMVKDEMMCPIPYYEISIDTNAGWIAHVSAGRFTTTEEAKANAAFIVKACNEYEKNKLAAKLLEELTPGGSEFYNDPQYCFDFVKKELRSIPSQILPFKKSNDKLKEQRDSLLEALKEAQQAVEFAINRTHSGKSRNALTDTNIKVLSAIKKCSPLT